MEPTMHLQFLIVIFISLSITVLFFPAEAKCIPRNSIHSLVSSPAPSPVPHHTQPEAEPTTSSPATPVADPLSAKPASTSPQAAPTKPDHFAPAKPASSPPPQASPPKPAPANDHVEPPKPASTSPLAAPSKPDHVEPVKLACSPPPQAAPTKPAPANDHVEPPKPASANDHVEPPKPASSSSSPLPQVAPTRADPVEPTKPGSVLHAITDPAIKKICAVTQNVDLCLASIAPFLNGKCDPASVLVMEIKACIKLSKFTKAKVTKIYEDPTTAGFTSQILSVCVDNYDDANTSLENAMAALHKHDLDTMNSMLSAALTYYGTCEDAFSERPGQKSPVGDLDDKLGLLIRNCLAISQLIK